MNHASSEPVPTTKEMTDAVITALAFAGLANIEATPWEKDPRVIKVTCEGTYFLLLSGSDVDTYTPGICLCDGLDANGYANVISVWNIEDGGEMPLHPYITKSEERPS